MLPKHNEILRLYFILFLCSTINTLILQINDGYQAVAQMYRDTQVRLQVTLTKNHSIYHKHTNPTNKPELLSRCPNITRHSG